MSFIIKNAKGMFAGYQAFPLVSEYGFKMMKNIFGDESHPLMAKMGKAQKNKLKEAFSLMEKLPVEGRHLYFMKNDGPDLVKKSAAPYPWEHGYGAGSTECLMVVGLENFNSSSGITRKKKDGMTTYNFLKSLEEQHNIVPFVAALSSFAKSCEVSFFDTPLRNVKKISKAIADEEYSIKDIDLVVEMGEAEASVVFMSGWGENGGYLDYKGGVSPLGGARLFESAGAAKRTISSQRIRDAIVVKVKTQIMEVESEIGNNKSSNTQHLREAIARVERKSIKQALESATIEQIKARLEKYEQMDTNKEAQAVTKKRAM